MRTNSAGKQRKLDATSTIMQQPSLPQNESAQAAALSAVNLAPVPSPSDANSPAASLAETLPHSHALVILERTPDGKPSWLACKMCPIFGCKTRLRNYLMLYLAPFKVTKIEAHLRKEHPAEWKEFKNADDEGKKAFFHGKMLPRMEAFQKRLAHLKKAWFPDPAAESKKSKKAKEKKDRAEKKAKKRLLRQSQRPEPFESNHPVKRPRVTLPPPESNYIIPTSHDWLGRSRCNRTIQQMTDGEKEGVHQFRDVYHAVDFPAREETMRPASNIFVKLVNQLQRHQVFPRDASRLVVPQASEGAECTNKESTKAVWQSNRYIGLAARTLFYLLRGLPAHVIATCLEGSFGVDRPDDVPHPPQNPAIEDAEDKEKSQDENAKEPGDARSDTAKNGQSGAKEKAWNEGSTSEPMDVETKEKAKAASTSNSTQGLGVVPSSEDRNGGDTVMEDVKMASLPARENGNTSIKPHDGVDTATNLMAAGKERNWSEFVSEVADGIGMACLSAMQTLFRRQWNIERFILVTRPCLARKNSIEVLISGPVFSKPLHIVSLRNAEGCTSALIKLLNFIIPDWRTQLLGVRSLLPPECEAKAFERTLVGAIKAQVSSEMDLVDESFPDEKRPITPQFLAGVSTEQFEELVSRFSEEAANNRIYRECLIEQQKKLRDCEAVKEGAVQILWDDLPQFSLLQVLVVDELEALYGREKRSGADGRLEFAGLVGGGQNEDCVDVDVERVLRARAFMVVDEVATNGGWEPLIRWDANWANASGTPQEEC